jgi:predicted nucleic acid-binding protein
MNVGRVCIEKIAPVFPGASQASAHKPKSIIRILTLHIIMAEETTIRVKKSTRELLRRLGEKGQSYDDIIQRILAERDRGSST